LFKTYVFHSSLSRNLYYCSYKRSEIRTILRSGIQAGPDLPIGYIGLSLGPQDPRGPPANCGTHRVNCRKDQFDKYSSKFYVLIIHEI